jgi:hypothetical protein
LPDAERDASRLKQHHFVTTNLLDLEKDISRGQGTSIVRLAALLGCEDESTADLGAFLQRNYLAIFAALGGGAVLEKMTELTEKEDFIRNKCHQLSV